MGYRRWFIVARRISIALALLVVFLSIGIRVRTYLLTRKIHEVLAGLERVQIDKTGEADLKKIVPDLTLDGSARYRTYHVSITNSENYYRWMRWIPDFVSSAGQSDEQFPIEDKWKILNLPAKVAYLLGWRQISFAASVTVFEARASGISYDIEPDILVSYPLSYFVFVRAVRGFWMRRGVSVPSTNDESPDFRFGAVGGQFSLLSGADNAIGVAYTPEASRALVSHAFQVDLTCFWGIRGCDSVRQVVPRLWEDRKAIETATMMRLGPGKPCPDYVLAGRVRTLPDLSVALLEVVRFRWEDFSDEGIPSQDPVIDFRLTEVLRGRPEGIWTNFRIRQSIPSPADARAQIPNPMAWLRPKAGDRFLYFSGANFDSCRIVPATPSAEAAVRTAVPAPRRPEDDIGWMLGRH